MNEEFFLQTNADRQNLLRLLNKRQSVDERIFATLRELMRPFATAGSDMPLDTAREIFNNILSVSASEECELSVCEKQNTINDITLRLMACICIDELSHGKHRLFDVMPTTPPMHGGVIACLKTPYTDKSLKAFSRHIASPRVTYHSDFNSVCEAVYDEKANYCILPIESSDNGRLNGFYHLIEKYELFICLCTDIYSNDDGAYTKFALCRKTHAPFSAHKRDGEYFAEILISPDGETSISDILFCADFLNIKTVKTECMPAIYSENDYNMYATFCGKERELYRLFMFFALQQIRYSYIGIYMQA